VHAPTIASIAIAIHSIKRLDLTSNDDRFLCTSRLSPLLDLFSMEDE
jgi:hypothetical protein